LISLGREKGPALNVRRIGQEHFNATMASLRIAFLSSELLELLSTLCFALVAVELGFRVMGYTGEVPLFNDIFVLILVAEVYRPLR
ncbi:thiol reductant ABC exporter subunit CydD, partial [Enterococcus faecium]